MIVELRREEALACIIVLENKKRLYGWQKSALAKLLKAMNMKPTLKNGVGR